jgi:hypothetical protein
MQNNHFYTDFYGNINEEEVQKQVLREGKTIKIKKKGK